MILPRIAVLASGEGTTLQSIMETCNIVLVISNNRDSGALRKAIWRAWHCLENQSNYKHQD